MKTGHYKAAQTFMVKMIADHLVGHRIVAVLKDELTEDGNFGFKLDNGTLVWVDCDGEGNGPGFLSLENVARPKRTALDKVMETLDDSKAGAR